MKTKTAKGVIGAALFCMPGMAYADSGDACVSSFEGAQEQRAANDPMRERAEIRLCLGACPTELARDCARWLAEIEPKIAKLRVSVSKSSIEKLAVEIDGIRQPVGEIELNPGLHRIRVSAPGYFPIDRDITLQEGEVSAFDAPLVELPPDAVVPGGPTTTEVWAPSVPGFILGGVGIASLSTALGLSIHGHLRATALRDECKPNCTDDVIDPIRNEWLASGIVAAVGGASLISGVLLVATHTESAPVSAGVYVHPRGIAFVGTF